MQIKHASKDDPWSKSSGETLAVIQQAEALAASKPRRVGRGVQGAMKCPLVMGVSGVARRLP
ncbi:MAG: hypothetical protein COV66_05485 [Nitrospinae bacterium CG11_big_fil_rev_8_21_14_0_20_45_15]|nr:MAG: hypothetical protein COV66_05485 [Nitrospinae bacterium CG11_big_fil_rev_8_21_14_0_20_45_15]